MERRWPAFVDRQPGEMLDEDIASNLQLAHEVHGTTDEVESNDVRPAPAPTAEDLQHTSVDISSSHGLDSGLDADTYHLQPLHPGQSTGSIANDPSADAIDLEKVLDVPLEHESNTGSESPAHHTLELPPALDLSQTHGKASTLPSVHNQNPAIDMGHG